MTKQDLKVKRMPVHEQVFDKIKNAITEEHWKVGEKIPTEMELSEMFGVNRLTVRMALQRLVGMGLLESRVGDGTYVKEFSFRYYMDSASNFYLKPELLDKVYEFRDVIEINCLALAIKRASDAEIEELGEICNCLETARTAYVQKQEDTCLQEFLEADIAFHEKICRLSHNDLFVYAFEMERPLLLQYMESLIHDRSGSWLRKAQNASGEPDKHRLVYDSLRERNLEKCLSHYRDIIDYQTIYA